MPKSRNRRKPVRSSSHRPTRPPADDSFAGLQALMTDDVMHELDRSLHAEADGDVEHAIETFLATPLAESSPHLRYLQEISDLGDEAPGWVWSRWILEQAHRWLFFAPGDERLREAAFLTVAAAYGDEDPERPRGMSPETFVAEIMARDWMCRQLALYELGGLASYLMTMAKPGLLKRADRIMAWPSARMAAFRIEAVANGQATLTELTHGIERQVPNLGNLAEGVGLCVVGRLVPMRLEPGWIFDSRPREVPDAVAEEVSRVVGPEMSPRWSFVLGEAVACGELDWPLGSIGCLTPLSSDLPPYTWTAPHGELSEAAWEVCTASLESAASSDRSAALTAPYVAAVLVDPKVYDAAREQLTEPEHAAAWEALARNTYEPVRSRCRELAALCQAAA